MEIPFYEFDDQEDLYPIITLIEEDEEDEKFKEDKDRIAIEELENAVFEDENYLDDPDAGQQNKGIADAENEERIIPIQLDNGDILNPKFRNLEDFVPPTWSIFHKSKGAKARNVKLSNFSNRPTSLRKTSKISIKSNESSGVESEDDIKKIMEELNMLGRLPLTNEDSFDDEDR